MQPTLEETIDAVEALGFTALEALMYVELLRSGPQSGYRIAGLVGKAPANTYKSLESLVARGAVLCDDSGTKVFRAVPFAQVAAALTSDFNRRSQRAEHLLAQVESRNADDGIYRLVREEQAFEHARALIAGAKSILLIDAHPRALAQVTDALRDAAARGVRIGVEKYRDSPPLPGAVEGLYPDGEALIASWTGEFIGIAADGSSMMAALIAHDGTVTSGIATDNRYIAWIYNTGLYHEILYAHLATLAQTHPDMSLRHAIDSTKNLVPQNPALRPRALKDGS